MMAIIFIALIGITYLTKILEASSLLGDPRCAVPWEYWCEDRCGSDSYGDTCCPISNGRHNLCGAGTSLVALTESF